MSIQITTDELNPTELRGQLCDRDHGAVVVFEGVVRAERVDGRDLLALDYTAYAEMAIELLEQIERTACQRFGARVVIAHGLGRLEVGRLALFVAVSTPHRVEGFAACQYIVNAIKADVPIWKREVWVT